MDSHDVAFQVDKRHETECCGFPALECSLCQDRCYNHFPIEFHCCQCGSCFPAAARVSLETGETITIGKLKRGDRVKTGEYNHHDVNLQVNKRDQMKCCGFLCSICPRRCYTDPFSGYDCCECGECFPAAARISLETGDTITMMELERGDRVKTGQYKCF